MEPAFIHTGFHDWNDAKRRFAEHMRSGVHQESVLKLGSSLKIDEMLNAEVVNTKEINSAMLAEVIRALKWLARQSLPIRGWSVHLIYLFSFNLIVFGFGYFSCSLLGTCFFLHVK